MKYLVASDIHGSAVYCGKMLEAFEREGADKCILLGDYLYHGPRNPFPDVYDTKSTMEKLNSIKDKVIGIHGNCDSEVDQLVLQFPITSQYTEIPLGKHMVFATHGHIYNKDNLPPLGCGDILLHGHTHVPAWEEIGETGMLYLNPGSISIPKGGSVHSYMILTEDGAEWHELESGEIYKRISF